MGYRISVDVGGTFTDIVLYDEERERSWVTKVPSMPENPDMAVEKGIRKIVQQLGIRYEDISY